MENNAGDRPLRHHMLPSSAGGGSGGGHREDCWSEGATAVLIEAWGERHLRCNRGNLRQNDWKEVSDAVNCRENGLKTMKTDVQCKNRIDTLKKKYKIEKAKPPPSSWPFFDRMDFLVGPNSANKKVSPIAPAANFMVKREPSKFKMNSASGSLNWNSNPNPNLRSNSMVVYSGGSSSRLNSGGSSESSLGGGENEEDDDVLEVGHRGGGRKHRLDCVDMSEEGAFRELARAILKFGEVYERIESSKQQQMMELERQRMEFIKELEFQKMNMLMEAQLEIEKLKRPKKLSLQARTDD